MNPQDLFNALTHSGKDPSHLIFEDELTGIYNRLFLFQYFQTKVQCDSLDNQPISLIMIDLDRFKKIIASELVKIAHAWQTYLGSIGLSSLTFLENFTAREMEAFIGVLGDLPTDGLDGKFWGCFSEDEALSGILFNQHDYDIQVAEATVTPENVVTAQQVIEARNLMEEGVSENEEFFESYLDDFPSLIKDMYLNNGGDEVSRHNYTYLTDNLLKSMKVYIRLRFGTVRYV